MGIPLLEKREALFTLSLSLSLSRWCRKVWITLNHSRKKLCHFRVFNSFKNYRKKHGVVYAVKEFFNIALQGKAMSSIIPAHSPEHSGYSIHSFMSAFSNSTGKR